MKRIKKYLGGSYFRLPSLSSEFQTGASYVANVPPYINTLLQQYITNTGNFSAPIPTSSKVKDNTLKDTVSNIGSSIIGKASDAVSDKIFGDSELGRNLGTIFSSGLNSVGDTVLNNAIKKAALTDGLTKNLGSSVGGAVAGLGANYLGRGITSILGNNAASRFLGLSASTVGGTIGGKILSSGTKNLFSGPGSINPIGLGMSAVGAGLSAATGPSKEYNGTYGSTTKALDTVYDALLAGIGLAPGGQIISGALALNKGLSNLFGSTDGMTSTDAILGSAFMPAPIKWLNMLGSSKTGTFNKQSWQNTLKTSNFMQNAFGDLEDKFSKAREEAGKIYGTFSQGAKKRALNNIDFSNFAWNKILNMADQNEYQNIRSSDMASINNLRYALWILGGFSPLARGKKGMKIFNNSINHNLGLRLLSGAALIDSKQMILSALNGTKIKKKGVKSGINVDYYDPNNVMSVVANNPDKTIVLDEMTVRPYKKLPMQSKLFQGITNQAANERADSLDEAHDLTPIFSNLITAGQISTMNEGALDLLNGKYLEGTTKLLSPAMFGSGIGGIAARSGIGGYNLFNKNGVRKTYNLFNLGHYGEGALSLLGDAFNAAMAMEGLGSISNALKGTSGYRNWKLAREINLSIKNNKPNIEVPNPTKYNISDNITLYRANPTNIKNPSYKGERYGDTSGLYVGKWFTDEPSKPNWYASNMAKKGEEPAYYLITVPKYWATKQKASHKISKSNIEYEPEDYIIEDGILGLLGQLYRGRPGTVQYLQQNFKTPKLSEPSTSLKFFERKPSRISLAFNKGYVESPRDITSDVGDLIAEGSERSTYTSKSNPNIVYKIEDAPLDDIKNIEIRKEIADDIIAPETTVGYYNRNGKYYRVTLLDKYKSWNPDDFDINYSPELDLEIIDALQKAKWNVELGTYNGAPYARTASKNGIKIGNLEYYNWGRDPHGNLKLIDLYAYSLKQGGKMNILEFLKNGSGIHIKPSLKGSFTKYCNGKVTNECIRRGKNSPNPKIRKKATFADNARHFKHKDGGKAFVNGVNVLDSNSKMYKYNKKYKMAQEGAKLTFWQQAGNWIKDNLDSISTIGNGISNLISAKNRLDEINLFAQAKQKELKAFKYKTWKDKYLSNLQNQTDRSDIVNAHNAFNLTNINDALQEKLDEINNLIANLLYLNNLQDTGLGDITSGLLGIATNVLLGTTKKKKIDNTFNPLANQTMNLIRGKLLDINANFSE